MYHLLAVGAVLVNQLSSGWSQPKVLTLAALCDMNNTLFLTLEAVSWDESVHLPRFFVLATGML